MGDFIAWLLVMVAVFYGIFKIGVYWGTQECSRWGSRLAGIPPVIRPKLAQDKGYKQ